MDLALRAMGRPPKDCEQESNIGKDPSREFPGGPVLRTPHYDRLSIAGPKKKKKSVQEAGLSNPKHREMGGDIQGLNGHEFE